MPAAAVLETTMLLARVSLELPERRMGHTHIVLLNSIDDEVGVLVSWSSYIVLVHVWDR